MTEAITPSGMRRMGRLGVGLAVLVLFGTMPEVARAVAAESTHAMPAVDEPVTPVGFPKLALLDPLAGLPVDSLARRAFVAGFRGAFVEDHFLTERADTAAARRWASEPLTNRFRLVEGNAFGDEWRLRVTLLGWWGVGGGVPPPRETPLVRGPGAGVRVAIEVVSGAAAEAGQRSIPTRTDLTFDVPPEPRPDFYSQAGRTVGLLAVEALHHRSGDLDPDTRLRLAHAVRATLAGRAPAPRR